MIFATSYYNFASIYKGLGDVELAKEYQQRALEIQLDKLGPEHLNVTTNYFDFEQAKEYQLCALEIKPD